MITKRIVMHYPRERTNEPLVSDLVRTYDLRFNILKASILPREEGLLVLELTGTDENFRKGMEYLKSLGILVEPLSQDVVRNEDRCVHCGACVGVCPTAALTVDPKTRQVIFHEEKCVACELSA